MMREEKPREILGVGGGMGGRNHFSAIKPCKQLNFLSRITSKEREREIESVMTGGRVCESLPTLPIPEAKLFYDSRRKVMEKLAVNIIMMV